MRLSRRGKRRLVVLIGVMVLLGAGYQGYRWLRAVQQERLVAAARIKGLAAHERGDLDTALNELKYVIGFIKDDVEVNLAFADTRAKLPVPGGKHLAEAAGYFNACLDLLAGEPQTPAVQAQRKEILSRLLDLYGQLGLINELNRTADDVLAIDPESREATAAKAELLYLDAKYAEAAPFAQKLIALAPEQVNYRRLYLGIEEKRGVKPDEIIALCRQWAAEISGDGRFHLLTARKLVELDRLEEARAELQEAVARGADAQEVLQMMVSLLDLLGLRDEATALIDATRNRFPGEQWPREADISRLWQDNRLAEALERVREAEAELPAPGPGLQRLKVVALISDRQLDEARRALEPLMQPSPADDDRAWATALAAALEASAIDWRSTVAHLQMALAASPTDPVVHFLLGETWTQMGETADAIASYREAYALAPNWLAAGLAYAESLLHAGRINDAYRISRLVLSRAPNDRLAPFILYARAYLAQREAGMASPFASEAAHAADLVGALEQAYGEFPANSEVASTLADAYVLTGNPDRAKTLMQAAIENEASDGIVLFALARVSLRRNLGLDGPLLERAWERGGPPVPIAFAQAQRLARAGRTREGLARIEEAIERSQPSEGPESPESRRLGSPDRRRAQCARIAYRLGTAPGEGLRELAALIREHSRSLDVQQFALSQSAAWSDSRVIAQAMSNLRDLLGEESPQVRLADANYLLRFQRQNPALLAKAIVQINTVLEHSPDSLAALSLMADALTIGEQPNLPRAIESLERASSLYPTEPSLLVRLIALLQREGNFERAGHHLRALAQLRASNPKLAFEELRLLQRQGDFETALIRATAIVTEESAPTEQLILAAIQERLGNVDQAQAIYERLLAASEPDPLVRSQAAEFYASTGRLERGLDLVQSIMPEGGPARKSLLVGAFLRRHSRARDAEEWLVRAVSQDPKLAEARHELALLYLDHGKKPAAREQALAGLKIQPDHPGMRATLAIADLTMPGSDRTEAIRLLRELGAKNDDLLATLELLEQVPMESGRTVPTVANLLAARKLVQEHGGFMPAWLLAISLHVEAGRLSEAIGLARDAVGRLPAHVEPSQWATQLLIDDQRWNEALVEAQEWRRRAPMEPLAPDLAIATVLLALERADEAVQQLAPHADAILAERQAHPERLRLWLRVLVMAGEAGRALTIVRPLLETELEWRQFWLAQVVDFDDALAYEALTMLEGLAGGPEERLGLAAQWSVLARRTSQPDLFDRAAALAEAAGSQPELKARSLVAQGAIAEARGDLPAAEKLYRQALELDANDVVALNNLAFVVGVGQQRYEEAMPFIERAVKHAPNHPDVLDTHGQILAGLGRLDEAEQAFIAALKAGGGRPNDVPIALNLLDMQIRLSKLTEAAQTLNLARGALGGRSGGRPHPDPALSARLNDLRAKLEAARLAGP